MVVSVTRGIRFGTGSGSRSRRGSSGRSRRASRKTGGLTNGQRPWLGVARLSINGDRIVAIDLILDPARLRAFVVDD
jgi:hypothetical protein